MAAPCVAYGILVPQPGIEPAPPALEGQSLNHWTTREAPETFHFNSHTIFQGETAILLCSPLLGDDGDEMSSIFQVTLAVELLFPRERVYIPFFHSFHSP